VAPIETSRERRGLQNQESTELIGPGPPGAVKRPQRFFLTVNRFCMVFLYGRAERLTAQNGGFRPRAERALRRECAHQLRPADKHAVYTAHGGACSRGRRSHFYAPCLFCAVSHVWKLYMYNGGGGVTLPHAARRVVLRRLRQPGPARPAVPLQRLQGLRPGPGPLGAVARPQRFPP
jgi:hypothetical protein